MFFAAKIRYFDFELGKSVTESKMIEATSYHEAVVTIEEFYTDEHGWTGIEHISIIGVYSEADNIMPIPDDAFFAIEDQVYGG